jgi:hypothetical protein
MSDATEADFIDMNLKLSRIVESVLEIDVTGVAIFVGDSYLEAVKNLKEAAALLEEEL